MRFPAPAKLNLFLHITGRREDGYHELQTVFQFIDLVDELEISVREDGKILRPTGLTDVEPEADLVVRAAKLLQKETNCTLGAEISVQKKIPAGGGLGGGSSDAATTLVALNQLWKTGLSRDQLAQIGLKLGADVPVFIHGEAVWAEGVGEQFFPIELPESWYLVIDPHISVSTAAIFGAEELTRDTPKKRIRSFPSDGGRNDCEPVVTARYPEIGAALQWLSQFGEAKLTGTGGCLFAAFQERAQAEQEQSQLPSQWDGFVVKGMNHSPLHQRA